MSTLMDRLRSSERERAAHSNRRLVEASLEAHRNPDKVDADFISRVCTEAGVSIDHFVSRVERLDRRVESNKEAVELPALFTAQCDDDAEQEKRAAEFERETQAYNERTAQRRVQTSRASNRHRDMLETAPYASWQWGEAMQAIERELGKSKFKLDERTVAQGWERDYIRWDQQQQDWIPLQGIDSATKAREALAAVHARHEGLEAAKQELRSRMDVLRQQREDLLVLALTLYPTAEQVAAIVGEQSTDGDDADGHDE